jgi:archaeal preflagellin peptidase FlaK
VHVLQEIFAAAQIALTVIVLVYTSYRDWKVREVSDRVWVIYGPIALALSLASFLLYNPPQLFYFIISVGVTVGFAFLLFYTSGFGGADAKAFMCIALSLPFFPQELYRPLVADGLSPLAKTVFPLTILTNSALIAASSGLVFLLWNLIQRAKTGTPLFESTLAKESWGKKIVVLATGAKFSLATLKSKWHAYPLEDINEEPNDASPKRTLVVFPKDEKSAQVLEHLQMASKNGKIASKVWATPGLPMLIFVTVGLVLALTLGDLVWILVSFLFG